MDMIRFCNYISAVVQCDAIGLRPSVDHFVGSEETSAVSSPTWIFDDLVATLDDDNYGD